MKLMNQGGGGKKLSLPEMNARINELLKQSIKRDGVINLFSDVKEEFSLFDPKFLADVARMKEKNLAVELLRKLIAEQIVVFKRTNDELNYMLQENEPNTTRENRRGYCKTASFRAKFAKPAHKYSVKKEKVLAYITKSDYEKRSEIPVGIFNAKKTNVHEGDRILWIKTTVQKIGGRFGSNAR